MNRPLKTPLSYIVLPTIDNYPYSYISLEGNQEAILPWAAGDVGELSGWI